jgi:hypothetical protein
VQSKAMCVTDYRQLVNSRLCPPLTVIQVVLLFTVVIIIFVRDLKMLIFTLQGAISLLISLASSLVHVKLFRPEYCTISKRFDRECNRMAALDCFRIFV